MASDTVKNSTAPLPPRRPKSSAEEMSMSQDEMMAMEMMKKHLDGPPKRPADLTPSELLDIAIEEGTIGPLRKDELDQVRKLISPKFKPQVKYNDEVIDAPSYDDSGEGPYREDPFGQDLMIQRDSNPRGKYRA